MNGWFERMIPHFIFCITTCLVLFGLVMVYSSSAFSDYGLSSRGKWEEQVAEAVSLATQKAGESKTSAEAVEALEVLHKEDSARRATMLSTFLRQARWVVLGFVSLTLFAMLDYPLWGKKIGWLVLAFLSFQVMLFAIPANTGLPLQARVINGSRSWIQLLSFRFQPSELAKLGLVIYAAWFLARRQEATKPSFFAYFWAIAVTGFSVGLILTESDKGVATHLCLALLTIWVLAGVRFAYIFLAGSATACALGALIWASPEARSRIFGIGFQLKHSLAAFSRGGLFGTGLGDGDADLAYLYGAHTDFILAVVGEELGFFATTGVVLGYLGLALLGLKVAAGCGDPFGTLLALGVTVLIGTQAFLNIAVVTGLAPTTGFTLPLVSYGGSSLVWTMAAIGILINVSLSMPRQLLSNAKRGGASLGLSGRVA